MRLAQLWGKTTTEGGFHPLVYHLLDVGFVAEALLSDPASPRLRHVLAHALGVSEPDTLREWLPFVCALHDIGKVSSPFQRQVPEQKQRLEALDFAFAHCKYRYPHQHLGAVALETLLEDLPQLAPFKTLLRDVVAGHHGEFSPRRALLEASAFIKGKEPPEWAVLRQDAVRVLRETFGLPSKIDASLPHLRAATAALAGFVILCDWLGSDTSFFPPKPDLPLNSYVRHSREQARRAVEAAGFMTTRRRPSWNGFQAVFPGITDPRCLQSAIDQLPSSAITWPALYIIEAPTGEGKTEAALALARRLASIGWSDEFYFALPTTATSNQMFQRVLRFLSSDSDHAGPVKLIHGQAFLSEDDLRVQALGDQTDPDSPAHAVPVWFAPKKRALLAPFGVGTVDQAELSVLSARHYVLRLFGLAGKVVIIDEIHAYDAYMNTVIEHALRWFATLGSPVILLSATLPAARHRQFARAYAEGLQNRAVEAIPADAENALPYPAISAYTANGSTRLSPRATRTDRRLEIEFVPDSSPGVEADRLLQLIEQGGAVGRITNTVKRAQDIYAALRQRAPEDVELHLLHARFPEDDRRAREARLAKRLGPGSTRSPSDRIIVLGTQLLEQSLDYDVDVMVSDMAPTDLLLQRAGRLQRHLERERLPSFQTPRLQVVVDTDEANRPNFAGNAGVYEPFVPWKSWIALTARTGQNGRITLTLPDDYRPLIESTYDDRLDVVPETHPWRESLEAAWEEYCRNQKKMEDNARERLIPEPKPGVPITEGVFPYFEEDEDGGSQGWGSAATRFGLESITVIPLHRVSGGVALDPDGRPITQANCDRDCQLQLLRRAIRVSHSAIVKALRQRQDPELGWFARTPLLRFSHPVVLENLETEIGNVPVRLDPELGLVIGKEDAP